MSNWIDVRDRLPELSDEVHMVECIVVAELYGGKNKSMSMYWTWNPRAKRQRDREPRWKWNGHPSPWPIRLWMPLPEPPEQFSLPHKSKCT